MRYFLVCVTLFIFQSALASGTAPENFYSVDLIVSRGAALTKENVDWLIGHGIKTIVKLDDENEDEFNWGIKVENVHINKFGFNLNYATVSNILNRIATASKTGKVYVHCEKGADRTGLIIALYRVRSGWSIEAARNEMNNPRFGHSSLQVWLDYKFEEFALKIASELPH